MTESFTREYFRKQGARGGKKGGKVRMGKLTPAQRSALAKHAVSVRELKRAERNETAPESKKK